MSYSAAIYQRIVRSLRESNMTELVEIMNITNKQNPYSKKEDFSLMWQEQCSINFPLLYVASLYLYQYAKAQSCDTFLFATRDCCHWYKIFQKMYPQEKVQYFHCSRNMFEGGIHNTTFKGYVESIVTDIGRTIFVDVHGTGRRMFQYFEKEFSMTPFCFLLSTTYKNYGQFPDITKKYHQKGKFITLVFDARGSPIEMMNYDLIGTLQNYLPEIGPVRDDLEYKSSLVDPSHKCVETLVNRIMPPASYLKRDALLGLIRAIYKPIHEEKPVIAKYVDHVANHARNFAVKSILDVVTFEEIISTDTVYGVIWAGLYNDEPCVVKIVAINPQFPDNTKAVTSDHFVSKKRMVEKDFVYEAEQLAFLSNHGLAPKVHGYTIRDGYGFIIMQRLDSSLKDILLRRSLTKVEEGIIGRMIIQLHDKVVHGDLKPSNIGVQLDEKGSVKECYVLDCQKVKHRKTFTKKDFNKLTMKDWITYKEHTAKNRKEGK